MRRLIMWNLITLDGFFERDKWDLAFHELVWGPDLEQVGREQTLAADLLLFGRVTYEGMAAHWPKAKGETADFMNSVAKVVFSRTLDSASWNNTRLVKDDAEGEVARLKQQAGKDMLIFGSADLSASLTRQRLIDEYRLCLTPVVLGRGNPLFRDEMQLKLADVRQLSPSGCAILTYRPE